MIINEDDYDSDIHELWQDSSESVSSYDTPDTPDTYNNWTKIELVKHLKNKGVDFNENLGVNKLREIASEADQNGVPDPAGS